MTPEDHAQALTETFRKALGISKWGYEHINFYKKSVKKCVSIAINEILKADPFSPYSADSNGKYDRMDEVRFYWKKVKEANKTL